MVLLAQVYRNRIFQKCLLSDFRAASSARLPAGAAGRRNGGCVGSAEPQEVDLSPFEKWAPKGLEAHAPTLSEDFWKVHHPVRHCVIRAPTDPIKWP